MSFKDWQKQNNPLAHNNLKPNHNKNNKPYVLPNGFSPGELVYYTRTVFGSDERENIYGYVIELEENPFQPENTSRQNRTAVWALWGTSTPGPRPSSTWFTGPVPYSEVLGWMPHSSVFRAELPTAPFICLPSRVTYCT